MSDPINPDYYKSVLHFVPLECIHITRHMPFSLGNAVKYIWRAGLKGDTRQDLMKASWYLEESLKEHGFFAGDELLNLWKLVQIPDSKDNQLKAKHYLIDLCIHGRGYEAKQKIDAQLEKSQAEEMHGK